MASNVVGTGVIVIEADAAQVPQQIEKQTKTTVPSAGSKIMSGLGKTLKVGAVAAGAGIAGVLGYSLTKGFQRLTAIDDARGKLTGLGHSGKATQGIMDNALKAVEGTAFGMGEAATTAATATAAGIEPGKQLTKYLTLVGDAATIAGTDMGTMGSVFNKVAATGKLTGDVVNQLSDRGIPVLSMLSDSMGKTEADITKMVSEGKVSFDDFSKAMQKGVGGAAQEGGKTFTGALANMQAAMGRMGAAMLEGIFPHLKTSMANITTMFDNLTKAIGPVADWIGKKLGNALNGLTGKLAKIDFSKFNKLFNTFKKRGGDMDAFKSTFGSIGDTFAGVGDKASSVGGVFQSIGGFLSGLTPLLTAFGDALPAIGSALGDVLGQALTFIADNFDVILKFLPVLISGFLAWKVATQAVTASSIALQSAQLAALPVMVANNALRVVAEGLARSNARAEAQNTAATVANTGATTANNTAQQKGVLTRLRGAAAWTAQKVAMIATTVATKAATVAQRALNLVMKANPIGLIITAIMLLVGALVWFFTKTKVGKKIVAAAWAGIKVAIKAVGDWFTNTLWPAIKAALNALAAGFRVVKNVVVRVWNAIRDGLGAGWNWIKEKVLNAFKAGLRALRAVVRTVKDAILAAWEGLKTGLKAAWDFIYKWVISPYVRAFRKLWDVALTVKDKILSIWGKLKTGLKTIWDWISKHVLAAFRRGLGALREAFQTVKTKIGGIWDGLKQKLSDVWDWIRDKTFGPMKRGVNAVKEAFRKAKDGIKTIWGKLEGIAKKPVNFMIETVYMKGIRALVGKVFGWLKKDNPLPRMASLHTGGYTGDGGKYEPKGVVHGGEYVLNKRSTSKFQRRAPGALEHLNRYGELPGYAEGGSVGDLKKGLRWWMAKGARVGEFSPWGSVAPVHMTNSLHYSGQAGDLNFGPGGQNAVETAFFNKWVGTFRRLFPMLNVLWRVAGHFNHMHIDTGAHGIAKGGAGGGGGFNFFGIADQLKGLKDKLTGALFNNPYGEMLKDATGKLIKAPVEWVMNRAGSFIEGSVDKIGGAVKKSKVWADVKRAAANFGGGVLGIGSWATGANWDAIAHIIDKESSWNPNAKNPTSSAAGLFQKMQRVHGPVEGNAYDQAMWGINYIKNRYGNPVAAWNFWKRNHHYDAGGWLPDGGFGFNTTGKPEAVLNPSQSAALIEMSKALVNPRTTARAASTEPGNTVNVSPGAIVINTPLSDPRKVANQVLDRLVRMAV